MDTSALMRLVCRGVEENLFPGAVIALGKGDTCLFRQAAGTIDGATPADFDTRYDMASITKVLATTMVALSFAERGLLRLTDTLGRFYKTAPEKRGITVGQLMTHTGGIPSFRIDEALGRRGYSLSEAVRASLDAPLLWPPGADVEYTCNGFIILGDILERVGGAGLDALSREIVFGPLGMRDTGYPPVKGVPAPTGWDDDLCGYVRGVQYDRNARYMRGVAGNAGVFSTIADMERFSAMLTGRGALSGRTFLREETIANAVRNRTPGLSDARGLGFQLANGRNAAGSKFPPGSAGHTGSSGTGFYVDLETGFYAIELTNRLFSGRDEAKILAFRRRFFDLAFEALEGR